MPKITFLGFGTINPAVKRWPRKPLAIPRKMNRPKPASGVPAVPVRHQTKAAITSATDIPCGHAVAGGECCGDLACPGQSRKQAAQPKRSVDRQHPTRSAIYRKVEHRTHITTVFLLHLARAGRVGPGGVIRIVLPCLQLGLYLPRSRCQDRIETSSSGHGVKKIKGLDTGLAAVVGNCRQQVLKFVVGKTPPDPTDPRSRDIAPKLSGCSVKISMSSVSTSIPVTRETQLPR